MNEPLPMDQAFVRKLIEIVLANLQNENFDVDALSQKSGMSRSGLNRKLQRIANKSTNQFIREVRLNKALELLQNESVTASEVSYKVGFSSPAYFNSCFHKYFGFPPGKVKKGASENPVEEMFVNLSSGRKRIKSVFQPLSGSLYRIPILFIFLVIAAITIYLKIIKKDTLDDLRSGDGRISVAVFPFQNMTSDSIWNGMQFNLMSYLSNYEELKVRPREVIDNILVSKGFTDYSSITPSVAGRISQKLGANVFIHGIINESGTAIRLNTQLINTKTKEVFKSFNIEGSIQETQPFKMIDSLSGLVKNFLVLSKMVKEVSFDLKPYNQTTSPEAYKNFILADNAMKMRDIKTSIKYYSKTVAIDSNFIPAIIFLSMRFEEQGMFEDAKKWCLKAYEKRDFLPPSDRFMIEWYHARLFETPFEQIKYLKQYQEVDDQVPVSYWQKGNAYLYLFQYSNAIPEFEKALKIYRKWGVKPMFMANYTNLGHAYHETGQYKKERRLYKKAIRDFPDDPSLLYWRQAILEFSEGDTTKANLYIEKYKSAMKDLSWPESKISTNVALIYLQSGITEKAEEYFRQALSMEPENTIRINNLAYFLIDKKNKINEGLRLIDSALNLSPGNFRLLHTKGWGLYKQGNYQEALGLLQKSWDLRMQHALYDHEAFLHLEEAKKAAPNKK